MHKQHTICSRLIHDSGVHGGAEHGARRAKNLENGRKLQKMRTIMVWQTGYMSDLDQGMLWNWYTFLCVLFTFLASIKPPWILEWWGRLTEPIILDWLRLLTR